MTEIQEIVHVNPFEFVAEARKLIGTPWHHTQRVPGVGIDCVGVIIVAAKAVNIPIEDITNYTRSDEFPQLIGHIERYCDKIDIQTLNQVDPLYEGDILVFRNRMMLNHCAIFSGRFNDMQSNEFGLMVHAYDGSGIHQVVEQVVDESWIKRLHSVYRYKGIEWQQ